MSRLLLLPVLAVLALLAPVSPASGDDTYTPDIPTSCSVNVPAVAVGDRVVVRVIVSASSNVPPTGTIELTIDRAGAARAARVARVELPWTKTVRYEGDELRIVGPRLAKGEYVAKVRFAPDGGAYLGCRDSARFRVGGGVDPDDEVGGEETLPDTGGPHLLLLLMGAAMVAVGGGFVGGSRRDGSSPAVAGRHRSHA
ncbi:MAG: LPXTG cell wall anchor domain-containing protein [Propionibacteriales bacterium]|nr:LPXTG cell wall anchor domain-containing protein [Propionibacteriales bacterium]